MWFIVHKKKIKCIRLIDELILKIFEDKVIRGCARAVFKNFPSFVKLDNKLNL